MLQELRNKWESERDAERRHRVKRRIDIYSNDWEDILREHIFDLFKDKEERKALCAKPDTSRNVLRWATDELAAVYTEKVSRSLEDDTYLHLFDHDLYDMALDQADKLMFVCREVFVLPVPVYDEDEAGNLINPHFELNVVTPDRATVLLSRERDTKMEAIAISKGEDQGFTIWTKDEHFTVNSNWERLAQKGEGAYKNPYGRIPWVACHARHPVSGFFHDRESKGIERATIQTGIALTDYNHLCHVQSFKQLALNGASEKEAQQLKVGPATGLHLKNGTVSVLDMQANLGERQSNIVNDIANTLNLYGISPDAVRGVNVASSGYALEIQRWGTKKVHKHHQKRWRIYEQELYDIMRIMAKKHFGIILPDEKLKVEFPDVGPAANPQEQLDNAIKAVQNELMSRYTAMQKLYGYTDEEILVEQQRIKEEKLANSPMGFDIPVTIDQPQIDEQDPMPQENDSAQDSTISE